MAAVEPVTPPSSAQLGGTPRRGTPGRVAFFGIGGRRLQQHQQVDQPQQPQQVLGDASENALAPALVVTQQMPKNQEQLAVRGGRRKRNGKGRGRVNSSGGLSSGEGEPKEFSAAEGERSESSQEPRLAGRYIPFAELRDAELSNRESTALPVDQEPSLSYDAGDDQLAHADRIQNGRSKGRVDNSVGLPSGGEELKELIAAQRKKSEGFQKPRLAVSPTAVAELRKVGSKVLPVDQPHSSYNNWDDPQAEEARTRTMDWEKEGPGSSNDSGSSSSHHRPQGEGDQRARATGRSSNDGPRLGKGKLPQGSHFLGQAPNGPKPNQTSGARQRSAFRENWAPAADSDRATKPHVKTLQEIEDRAGSKLSRIPPPREFGGRLTTASSETSSGKLRAEAPEFEPAEVPDKHLPPHLRRAPGQSDTTKNLYPVWGPVSTSSPAQSTSARSGNFPYRPRGSARYRGRGNRSLPIPHIPLAPNNTSPEVVNMAPQINAFKGAEQIGSRIHREIADGTYECMVCISTVTRKTKVWSCNCCWAVFHLNCIQKWAKQGLEQPPSGPVGVDGDTRNWRCPGCKNPENEVPTLYTCWCGGEVQPEVSKILQPHSCGQTCGKQRSSPKSCPHACDLQCHAGPCPTCTAIGPKQTCHCGKDEIQKRCVDTMYEDGWSCGQVCDDDLPCGKHKCTKPCHPGVCGSCQELEELRCFCGDNTKPIKCCEKQKPVESAINDIHGIEKWFGYWSCDMPCDRYFDCAKHMCSKSCHTQGAEPIHCPLSADVVTHCPCGKTKLSDLLESPRADCEAAIPVCHKLCGKALKCGHPCGETCHDGECGVCTKTIEVTCNCGRTAAESLCHQGESCEPPSCMRLCKTGLSCGRHECGEKCCSGEAKALERLASRKKMKSLNSQNPGQPSDDRFELEHICTRLCDRQLKCGSHTCEMLCHRGPCSTCPEASFNELSCHCGKTSIQPPVPCGATPPKCDYPCTRTTDCGHPIVPHSCHIDEGGCPKCPYLMEKLCLCKKKVVKNIPCWKHGVSCGTECGKKLSCGSHNCHSICHAGGKCEEPCRQQCGKPKSCGHPCLSICHAPFQCPEDKPCPAMVQLTCSCGGLKQEVRCSSTKANPTGGRKELKCNDQCRSRRMALALDIDPDRESGPTYCEATIFLFLKDKHWAAGVEEKFRAFAESTQKHLPFPPMRSTQRAFIHSLAGDFGFSSHSQDPEPYRSVSIHKGSSFTVAPKKTMMEYVASKPSAVPATVPVFIQQLKKPRKNTYNAVLLQGIKVGVLASEIEKELEPVLKDSQLRFSLHWTGDEEVMLLPKASSLADDQVELELAEVLCHKLKCLFATKGLADKVELVLVGRDRQIVSRESGGKWSVVAGGRSANPPGLKAPVQAGVGASSRFELGRGTGEMASKSAEILKKKKKKKMKEKEQAIVDDWEMAADDEANTGPHI